MIQVYQAAGGERGTAQMQFLNGIVCLFVGPVNTNYSLRSFQHVQSEYDSKRYQTTAGSGTPLYDFRFRPTVAQAIGVKVLFED
jgi:hypothetical protein